jgi:hypothetical protein
MAAAFDVGLPFLDAEIAEFICSGRISAKIDKVGCVSVAVCVTISHQESVWEGCRAGGTRTAYWGAPALQLLSCSACTPK